VLRDARKELVSKVFCSNITSSGLGDGDAESSFSYVLGLEFLTKLV
jgi:hypothetical protein